MSSVGRSRGEALRCAPAPTQPIGIPVASTSRERLVPCLPRSTGDLPAASPPQGALTMQPSTVISPRSSPTRRVVGLQRDVLEPIEDPGLDPLITPLADRGRRARAVGDPRVPDPVDQDLDQVQLDEHNPIGDPGPMTAEGMGID